MHQDWHGYAELARSLPNCAKTLLLATGYILLLVAASYLLAIVINPLIWAPYLYGS